MLDDKESHLPEKYDDALDYLHRSEVQNVDNVNLFSLRRKIDIQTIPFFFGCYFLMSLNHALINYAGVMGMRSDLNLQGNDFSNAATWLEIATLIAEIPTVYILHKIPTAKWLGLNFLVWGITLSASSGTTNYAGLLTSRIFLGIFEASIGPSLMLLSAQYYTKQEQSLRFTFWFLGMGMSQIIGGLISFGFQHVHHAALAGWRIMFLVVGLVGLAVGGAIVGYLPDTPMKARWLSEEEKVALLRHVSVNQTGVSVRNEVFCTRQIVEALLDPQIWLWALIAILSPITSGVVAVYSTTLIHSFGFTSQDAALLNMPCGAVNLIFTLLVGIGIRHTNHRWGWVIFTSIPPVLGGGLLAFLHQRNKPGMLAGVYLVNSAVAVYPIVMQWTAANCAGATKRAFAGALMVGCFAAGQIIGPQTFQARDAPVYRPAKITVLAVNAASAVCAVLLMGYYVVENRRRDREGVVVEEVDAQWANLTDKENRGFRYVY